MTAPVISTPHGSRDSDRTAVRTILRTSEGLIAGDALALVYVGHRRREAALLCAYARAAEVPVTLHPVPDAADPIQRAVRTVSGPGRTVMVLADRALTLPPDAAQLAGTADRSPFALWLPPATLTQRAAELRAALPSSLVIRTRGLTVRTATGDWSVLDGGIEAESRHATGTFTADAAIAVNRETTWDARLAGREVRLTLADGRVTEIACPDPVLRRFLHRAVLVHGADRVTTVRFGLHPEEYGFTAVAGPPNARHPGVTLRLAVTGDPYHSASADLRIDLTATLEGDPT